MEASIRPMDKILPILLKAVSDWEATNTEAVLRKKVLDTLNTSSDTITMKLLGFKQNWNTWEIDHCNGRAGESAAGDFLKKVQQATIEEWLTSNVMPTLTPALLTKLKKEFQSEYANHLFSAVRRVAQNKATIDAEALISNIGKTDDLSKYMKTLQLLKPTN